MPRLRRARRRCRVEPRPGFARLRRLILAPAPLALMFGVAPDAGAHAFAQRYDLPLPLYLFLLGGGITVAVSFLVVALAARTPPGEHAYARFDLRRTAAGRALSHHAMAELVRVIGVVLFLTLLIAGFFGAQNPFRNIVPTLAWIIGWIGLAYVCALIGDAWFLLNPFRTLYGWLERGWARVTGGRKLSRERPLPSWLGVWPAALLLLVFSWAEIVWQGSASPAGVAGLVLAYSALTFAGMHMFGREAWLARGEVFNLVFGLFARFAPTEARVRSPARCRECHDSGCGNGPEGCVQCYGCLAAAAPGEWEWNLRPWGAGLVTRTPLSTSMTVLVCIALATVTFDGLRETPFWEALMSRAFHPFQPTAGAKADLLLTAGLLLTACVFVAVYAGCCALMSWCVRRTSSTGAVTSAWTLARLFVLSLLPIAIAYHLAHYLQYLLVAGQFIIPLASDPLGYGWNLFGTADFRTDADLVGPRFSWYTALIAIVAGHIIAMRVAHSTALYHFPSPRVALASQYPLAVLMIVYTVLSLWILAQPVVEQLPHG